MKNSLLKKVSIIGSASSKGVKASENFLNQQTWEKMCEITENYILNNIDQNWSQIQLISGGAAWCDHIAVHLYLKHPETSLMLHFPCKWDTNNKNYVDNGKSHWAVNPGHLANLYHESFQRKIGQNTLSQIQKAVDCGAQIHDNYKGFHDRNTIVGICDYLIAFTFSHNPQPNGGGTADTWKKSSSTKKVHFCINNLESISNHDVIGNLS